MRDHKNKTCKPAIMIFALSAVLGSAFFFGGANAGGKIRAFSASVHTSADGIMLDFLDPDETTTLNDAIGIIGGGETTSFPDAIGTLEPIETTTTDDLGFSWEITEETTTTPDDAISFITDPEETTTLPDPIGTGGGTDTPPPTDSETPDVSVPGEPPALILTYYTYDLTVGQEAQVYWKVENSVINNYTEAFSSDNPGVASVNETGLITAHSAGTANITITWGDLSASALVTVSEENTAPLVTAPPVTLPPPDTEPIAPVTDPSTDINAGDPTGENPETPAEMPKVKLDGCLYDTKGAPMASISLNAGGQTAITDINGYFTFYDLNAGDTVISVSGNDRLACVVGLSADATVFLIYNGESMECCFSYEEMANRFVITKIEVEAPNKRIYAGDTVIPYFQYEPRDAAVTQTQYLSSNENVATIDANGVINAIAEGETVITLILNGGQAQTEFTLTVSPEYTGKYSGLIAAGETLLVLLAAGAAFIIYKRYKKRMAGDEEDDE